MSDINKCLFLLIKSGITGKAFSLPDNIDMEALYSQLKRHSIIALGYTGLVNCGADKNHPVMQKLFRDYIAVMLKSEKQLAATERLFSAFEEKGIDYLPLKGTNLKKLYPKQELRVMGDADILVREEQYGTVAEIMSAQGFEQASDISNTLNWKNNALYAELHLQLVPPEDSDYLEYFGSGWERAVKGDGHRYHYSPEDEFIFIFAHYARHFRFGGIGLRQFADLWVYSGHYSLNGDILDREFDKLGLGEFYRNSMKAVAAAFEEGPADEKTEFITDFIVASGNWGDTASYAISALIKDKGDEAASNSRLKTLIRELFPVKGSILLRYPVLQKHRYLLPLFWIIRFFDALVNRRRNIRAKVRNVQRTSDAGVNSRIDAFKQIGLDFNN